MVNHLKKKSANLDLTSVDYGKGLVDRFKDQIEIDVTGDAKVVDNPNYLKGGATPDPKNPGYDTDGNRAKMKQTESYTIKDPKQAKEVILNYFNDANGIVSFNKNKPVPSEKELWAMLQDQGKIQEQYSWNMRPYSSSTDKILREAYADYIVETMSPTGQEKTNITKNFGSAIDTSKYK